MSATSQTTNRSASGQMQPGSSRRIEPCRTIRRPVGRWPRAHDKGQGETDAGSLGHAEESEADEQDRLVPVEQ